MMRREIFVTFWWRILLLAGAFYLLWRIRTLIFVIVLATILYYMLAPFVKSLCKWRIWKGVRQETRRSISALIVWLLALGVLVGGCYLILSPLVEEARDLQINITKYSKDLIKIAGNVQQRFLKLPEQYQNILMEQVRKLGESLSKVTTLIISKTLEAFGHILEILAIPIIALYLSIGSKGLRRELFIFIPPKYARRALLILKQMDLAFRQYIAGQAVLCILMWIIIWGILTLFKMNYALTLGVIAGVARAIPVIGPIIGGAPIVLFALVKSLPLAFYILLFYSFLQLADDKFILPFFIGHQLHLHPVTIVLAVLIGGEFFGILGMFMAVPVAAAIKSTFQIIYMPYSRRKT